DLPLSGAAADLGITGTAGGGGDTINGGRVLAGLNSTLIANLRGGQGLGAGATAITARAGSVHNLVLPTGASGSDVLDAVGDQSGGKIVASLDATGTGLVLTDTTGGAGNLGISGAAAEALGLATEAGGVAGASVRSARLQHRYVAPSTLLSSLNGGAGIG